MLFARAKRLWAICLLCAVGLAGCAEYKGDPPRSRSQRVAKVESDFKAEADKSAAGTEPSKTAAASNDEAAALPPLEDAPGAGPPATATDPVPLEAPPDVPQLDDPAASAKSPPAPPGGDGSGPLLVAAAPSNEKKKRQAPERKDRPVLIPREVLFGNPEKAMARISSDGRRLAYLAPLRGVLNVWVGPADDPDAAKPVTKDQGRGVRRFFWAYTNRHIIYLQDKDGDENWRVYSVDVESGERKDLTPLENVRAEIESVSEKFPEQILVGLNDRDERFHDVYRVHLLSGQRELVQKNPGLAGFLIDDDYQVRLAMNYTATGGQVLLKPEGDDDWKPFLEIGPADALTTGPAGFDKSGKVLYFIDSRNRNTSALTALEIDSGQQQVLAEHPRADVGGILLHPTEKTVQAVSFTYARREWKVLDPAVQEDLDYLNSVEDGEVQVTSRTLDDTMWTVAYIVDDGPLRFYLYDRKNRKATHLFDSRSDLARYELAKMHAPIIEARDGLELVSYLTLPPGSDPDGDGRPQQPVPMVLQVHGGPWARDTWGFDAAHQWLANRGYAVLSVNFRGSTGFGKEFLNAANSEWAGRMHDDLIDAVRWAVKEGIANEDQVAIMGGSYGGYAALVGLTFTPEVFACGVDIVGPSNLVTLLNNVPPYWMPFMPVMKDRVGDHTTVAGREALLAKSPLTKVDRIVRPLLIAQGANDPRVKQQEADQIVAAMREREIPVTYVLYPDEGHGFARPENRMSFYAVVEAFLAEHLGGRFQPIGDAFDNASITVPAGADQVPGLAPALKSEP